MEMWLLHVDTEPTSDWRPGPTWTRLYLDPLKRLFPFSNSETTWQNHVVSCLHSTFLRYQLSVEERKQSVRHQVLLSKCGESHWKTDFLGIPPCALKCSKVWASWSFPYLLGIRDNILCCFRCSCVMMICEEATKAPSSNLLFKTGQNYKKVMRLSTWK